MTTPPPALLYILSGRGIAEIDEAEYEVGLGNFMGFGLPQLAHHLRNPFEGDLVYLMGGEKVRCDIGVFPRLGQQSIRDGAAAYLINEAALKNFWPETR